MAMNPNALADAIFNAMQSVYWPDAPLPPEAEADLKKYYSVLAAAVIDYIKENVEVSPGSFNVPGYGAVVGRGKVQ